MGILRTPGGDGLGLELGLPGGPWGVHWRGMGTARQQQPRHVDAVTELERRLRACEAQREELSEALQRECELRAQCEARFARVFEATPNLMTISTLEDGRVLVASDRVMETFGYTREEVIGRTSRELGMYADYGDREAYVRELRAHGRVSGIEVPIRRRDGEVRHGLFSAEVIDLDGKRVLLSTLTDITDRKRDEAQLRRDAQIMEQIHDAVVVTDMQGRITSWNNGATRTFGHTATEALGQPIHMLYAPRQKAFLQKRIIAPLMKAGEHRLEVAARHRTGATVWLDMSLSLLRDASGTACAMIGYSKDITRRKQAEEALQKVHAELEQKVRERTARLRALTAQLTRAEDDERQRLARILHDDLQQIVAGARFTLNGLKKDLPADARAQLVNQIDACLGNAIQLMRTMSHDLHPPELESAGLGAALCWLARDFESKFDLPIALNLDPAAEPGDGDLRIFLFQAARELLFNVAKHAKVHEAQLTLRTARGGHVQMEVRDEGVGFVPASLPPQRFGLLGIRERAEHFGGRLDVRSVPGRGTRVMLVLPRAPLR